MAVHGAGMFSMEFDGFPELASALEELPTAAMKESVILRALKESSKPMEDATRAGCPREEGDLSASVTIRKLKRRAPGEVAIAVGPAGRGSRSAHLIELGTVDRIVKATGRHVGRMTPTPFLRPAFDATKDEVLRNLAQAISAQLLKVAQRLGRRAAKGTLGAGTRKALLR